MNGRVLQVPSNGQRRVAEEIAGLLAMPSIRPFKKASSGIPGHLWEQVVLPLMCVGRPLWSPSTSGPVFMERQVVTVHDIAFIDAPQFFSRKFVWLYAAIAARLFARARHIVTVSNFTRDRLLDHYSLDPSRVSCIHSGCSAAFYPRSVQEQDRVRTSLGIGTEPYLVGFYGHDPRKNAARLLKAWSIAAERADGAKLVLFGRVSNRKVFAVGERPPDDPSVIYAGAVSDDDLAVLFSGARAFVFPSLYEGFGLPVIEAARCGARIITSNTTALPEVSPADAALVDPLDVSAIVDAIGHALDEDDDESARARRIAEISGFDWQVTASKYQELFARMFA